MNGINYNSTHTYVHTCAAESRNVTSTRTNITTDTQSKQKHDIYQPNDQTHKQSKTKQTKTK